jgi:hypothetical protein
MGRGASEPDIKRGCSSDFASSVGLNLLKETLKLRTG